MLRRCKWPATKKYGITNKQKISLMAGNSKMILFIKLLFLIGNSLSLISHNIYDLMIIQTSYQYLKENAWQNVALAYFMIGYQDSSWKYPPLKMLEFGHCCYEYLSWKVIKRKHSSSSEYIPHYNHTLWHSAVNVSRMERVWKESYCFISGQ